MQSTATAIQVVQKIVVAGFRGIVPSAKLDVEFVFACISIFAADAPLAVQERFAFEIAAALITVRALRARAFVN